MTVRLRDKPQLAKKAGWRALVADASGSGESARLALYDAKLMHKQGDALLVYYGAVASPEGTSLQLLNYYRATATPQNTCQMVIHVLSIATQVAACVDYSGLAPTHSGTGPAVEC